MKTIEEAAEYAAVNAPDAFDYVTTEQLVDAAKLCDMSGEAGAVALWFDCRDEILVDSPNDNTDMDPIVHFRFNLAANLYSFAWENN